MMDLPPVPGSLEQRFQDPNWGAERLRKIALFKQFTHEELVRLYQSGEIRILRPNSYAVIEGEPSRGLYIILGGTVAVYKNDVQSGAMHRIAFLEEGAGFGEMSLFDVAPRSATVAAVSTCYLFYLDVEAFEKYLNAEGENSQVRFYKTCAETMGERFRAINNDFIISQQQLWKYALRRAEDEGGAGTKEESSEGKKGAAA